MANESLGHYDCAIVGTDLASSILAAALAKAGRTVIHLDSEQYYGSSDASLSLQELVDWAKSRATTDDVHLAFPSSSPTQSDILPVELAQVSRQYALSLAPSVLPAVSDFIDAVVRAGVSRYTGFRLLDAVAVCGHARPPKRVPASKEDVFKDRELGLPEKRRLMKFLLLAAGDFEASDAIKGHEEESIEGFLRQQMALSGDLLSAVTYAVALCSSSSDPTLAALRRLRSYLRASGRYGNSPFLVGQYGGAGELAQGFCRVCAVFGGTYVLGRTVDRTEAIQHDVGNGEEAGVRCQLGEDHFTVSQLVTPGPAPASRSTPVHRGVIILDAILPLLVPTAQPEPSEDGEPSTAAPSEKQAEAALFVFPPETFADQHGSIQALVVGESVYACPAGQHVLYLSTPAANGAKNASDALRLALDALLNVEPRSAVLFELFYTDRPNASTSTLPQAVNVQRQLSSNMADVPGLAVAEAHRVFKLVVGDEAGTELFQPSPPGGNNDDDEE